MFDYVIGNLISHDLLGIVVENNGIGYRFQASTFTIDKFVKQKHNVKVYTYMQVREDGVSLFGFATTEERELFLKLITVSGVGPKIAIQILSGVSTKELILAIVTNDTKLFASIKGIGKKTAERIILELKEKINNQDTIITDSNISANDIVTDAINALMQFGFSRGDSTKVVNEVYQSGDSIEALIAKALKSIR